MHDRSFSRRWLMRGAAGGIAALPGTGWLASALAQGAGRSGLLRIGMAAPNTTLDPHFQSNAPNNAVASHIFDALVTNDAASNSTPGLAASWRRIDDTNWEFALRSDVTFSDGSPFTAEDAIASLRRANDLPSVATFRTYTRSIKAMSAPTPHTLRIETSGPDPLLLNSLSRIRIISAKYKDAPTPEFNNGNAAIGTGAFVLKEHVPGSRIVLTRNENWWGGQLPWSEVQLRIATDNGGRLAGLLAGEFDIIEALPSQGAERVTADQRFHVISGISGRVVYLGFDHHRDASPFVAGIDGKPLDRNPLKDVRVRQAIALSINQQAIHERVMEGKSAIASQFLPNGRFGTSDALKPAAYDPDRARALLRDAGYPNGFRLTVHGPNDRFINDAKLVQAVAQMLTRIGIQAQAEVMPWSVYSKRNPQGDFSFFLSSWGVNTGETSNPLKAILATYDRAAGMGASNAGRYSNPEVDRRLTEALLTMDDAKRGGLLGEASRIAFEDVAIIPLHHEVAVWAARKGIGYETRADQYTLAMGVVQQG